MADSQTTQSEQEQASLYQGGVLAWCREAGSGRLADYLAKGGFAGARRAAELGPAGVIAELRAGGLREFSGAAQPVYLDWRALLQSPGDKTLVVDARRRDPRSLVTAAFLEDNPLGLVEALFIGALATKAEWARLLLSPDQSHLLSALHTLLAEAVQADLIPGLEVTLELDPHSEPEPDANHQTPRLVHSIDTWYQLPLLLAQGAEAFAAKGRGSLAGTRVLTVGGSGLEPHLVEAGAGTSLGEVLAESTGMDLDQGMMGLALDNGLSGFLPPDAAGVVLAPEEMCLAGVDPAASTVWAMGEEYCVVDLVRHSLIEIAGQGSGQGEVVHRLGLNALRLVTQISLRRAQPGFLDQLGILADKLLSLGASAGWPLKSSLLHFPHEWEAHAANRPCAAVDPLKPLLAPCQNSCPAGIDIPAFVALTGQGEYRQAVEVIRRDNPLPYICGLVCPAPCEEVCLRSLADSPVYIRDLKAVAARHCLAEGGYPLPPMEPDSGKRLAVIGAGPAGLSAAYFLALRGHRVEIFESQELVGGTMLLGIPAYRLPREVIAAEVKAITALGVKLHTNTELGRDFSVESLRADGFDAVFLGIGSRCGYSLGLDGEETFGPVLDALTFLRAVALGDTEPPADRVVVVGGGNAAMDAARTCIRLGCEEVTIAYRRTRSEMPAHEEEIEAALAEGVNIKFLAVPKRVVGRAGKLTGMECLRAKLGEPDASGRRSPIAIEGSEEVIQAGAVIAAIGQQPDLECLGDLGHDEAVCSRTIVADPVTGQSGKPWLFAGGDAVTGPRTVVEAVAQGKRAAWAMDAYLREQMLDPAFDYPHRAEAQEPIDSSTQQRETPRAHMALLDMDQRVSSFAAVELGLSDEQAQDEARRCLRCDLCIGCGLCQAACDEVGASALQLRETPFNRRVLLDFNLAAERCVGCGSCAASCPTGAIRIVDVGDKRQVVFTGTVIKELEMVPCSLCGQPFASQAYLDQLDSRMTRPSRPEAQRNVCPVCVRQLRASRLLR